MRENTSVENQTGVADVHSNRWLAKRLRLIKPTILRETHDADCTCSYCKDGSVGIVLTACKAWNAWRSIRWYRNGRLNVIRWTLFKIEYR